MDLIEIIITSTDDCGMIILINKSFCNMEHFSSFKQDRSKMKRSVNIKGVFVKNVLMNVYVSVVCVFTNICIFTNLLM